MKRVFFSLLRICSTLHARSKVARAGDGFTVNFPCGFTRATEIGNFCHFNGIKVRGDGRLVVGDYFHSGEDILVITQNHNYRDPTMLPYDHGIVPRDVVIGRYVWVGSRVILLPGATIGDGVVIQAGAVVGGTIPDNAIVGGNPAKVIRFRDAAAVARLVSAGKFLK